MNRTHPSSNLGWTLLFLAWLSTGVATLGSLFFSEVMQLPPCILCWYQRICLFPLVVILPAGLFPFDKRVVRYALPLAVIGWLAAFYHNLLYFGIIPERLQPCGKGISCTEDSLNLFGFLSIPMLSALAFSTVIVMLILVSRRSSP